MTSHHNYIDKLLDITAPMTPVEVEIREDGQVLWVHLEGRTVLRVCRIPGGEVIVTDHRPHLLRAKVRTAVTSREEGGEVSGHTHSQ